MERRNREYVERQPENTEPRIYRAQVFSALRFKNLGARACKVRVFGVNVPDIVMFRRSILSRLVTHAARYGL
jgi:hypothetical protein